MHDIPERISTAYEAILLERNIPLVEQKFYKKWLRYYLDFCHKYTFPVGQQTSLANFLEELHSKRQSEQQCQQAQQAISLFYDLCEAQRGQEGNVNSKQNQHSDIYPASVTPVSLVTTQSPTLETMEVASPDEKLEMVVSTSSSVDTVNAEQVDSISELGVEYQLQGTNWAAVYTGLKEVIELRHYSPKTLKTYQSWMRKFQAFVKSKDYHLLNQQDVKNFLTHLAVSKQVAASTQNQAFNALLFLFRHVLKKEFGEIKDVPRAKRRPYIPVVLSREEIDRVLERLRDPFMLAVQLLYGCGLRISECLNLRLQDFNFDVGMLTVHRGKGKKDRTVPLPQSIMPEIKLQFERVSALYDEDLAAGYAGVFLPDSLEEKYKNAAKDFSWQWFFPAKTLTFIAETKEYRRYHLHDTHLQKAIRGAVKRTKLAKRVSAHTFRHSFASHLVQAHYDIRTIQALMGHADVKTTMVYLQTVPSLTLKEAKSPLDFSSDSHEG
ncbi:integron integrase [Candidatus Venteria ishoeyi]|uniref:Tyrosine recombinase XerC n=1 Tax=Candidatus Venteria ishoeyi TaxID=1899563 RepID=A0A1H6F3I5_9GAMM|nr:integron integrase [Candidatus Venteria ishoeyi]SEH04680.1 Tyrosine recombinase XerC [Candidatus Venteria ishoeyi]